MPARWQDYAMENQKRALRAQLKSQRPHSSEGLTQQLLMLVEKLSPKTIASYQPLPGEPDLSEFNELVSKQFLVLYPRVIGENLEFASGDLRSGAFSISEPTGEATAEIDLVLVPALAADFKGNRLGKGKGFYDRFLSGFAGKAYAIVFDQELLPEVPIDSHDQRVNGVITPKRIVEVD
jgi:5-formyltetrahydrofolate cyclo-ligase